MSCNTLEKIEADRESEGREGAIPDNIRYLRFHNLLRVTIQFCSELLDLTWLIYAPSHQELYVRGCSSIEQVMHDDHEVADKKSIFSRLTALNFEEIYQT